MRHQLKQFEGQNVVIIGRMTKRITQPNGTVDICLAAIEVRPIRSDIALDEIKPVKVDHAWIQGIDEEHLERGDLLIRYCGAATVRYYTRKNGTVDLGFVSVPSINVEQIIIECKELSYPLTAALLRNRLNQVDDGSLVWGLHISGDRAVSLMRRKLKQMDGTITRTFGTYLTATANGPCRGLDVIGQVKQSRKTVQGFA